MAGDVDRPAARGGEKDSERTVVYPDDLLRYYSVWDEKLLNAFPDLLKVSQPLMELLPVHVKEKATKIALEQEHFDSILHCYYPAKTNGKINGEAKSITHRSQKIKYPF